MISIRPARRDDMFEILQLVKEGGSVDNPTYPKEVGPPAAANAVFIVQQAIDREEIDVAVKDDIIVGVVVASKESFVWNGKQFLSSLFVYLKPEARVGTDGLALVRAMVDRSKKANLPFVCTIHEHAQTEGHAALLERSGFKKMASMFILEN